MNLGQDVALSSADGSPGSSAGGCLVAAFCGGNVEGAPELLFIPILGVAGLEVAH